MVLSSNHIFKKSAADGSVTIYLGKRDFVDHFTYTDPIEGIVLIDPTSVKNKNVYVEVIAIFRYGREEDEVLGMSFSRELYLSHKQIYPRVDEITNDNNEQQNLSDRWLFEQVLQKLGTNALPFRLVIPCATPISVTMLPNGTDTCGVRYYIRCYVASTRTEKPSNRCLVNLAIRKIQYAPLWAVIGQPSGSTYKDFPLSSGKIFLEATMDKKLYYHGEEINLNVLVQNYSHKTVKHVKVSVVQVADICMFSSGKCKVSVASLDSQENCPIQPGSTYYKRFGLLPDIWSNNGKYGIFTNHCNWMEDKSLASSVMISEKDVQDFFGILISYQIKVKLYVGSLTPLPGSDVSIFLPFLLMHRNPARTQNIDILHSDQSSPITLVNSIVSKKTDPKKNKANKYSCTEDFIFDDLTQVQVHRVPLIT
ncbi:phosrestin-2-like [Tachypleus tridentatus]|uniref:phosrestin-2-like n=1 Tax=Tachypleus tridentatus TaxID=6853 RepID=UPI003FD46481